jgi:hypothetical protein
MYFLNIGLPQKRVAKFGKEKGIYISEPLVLIDGRTHGYILPLKGFGLPLEAVLYEIEDLPKFKEKVLAEIVSDLFEISARSKETNKKEIAFATAARPFQQLDLSLEYGFKTKSKHIRKEK